MYKLLHHYHFSITKREYTRNYTPSQTLSPCSNQTLQKHSACNYFLPGPREASLAASRYQTPSFSISLSSSSRTCVRNLTPHCLLTPLPMQKYFSLRPPATFQTSPLRFPEPKKNSSRHDSRVREQKETYNSGDSPVVTHLTTSPPVRCLSKAERTGSPVFNVLWSYVLILLHAQIYKRGSIVGICRNIKKENIF
jgi:hypothetical protein